MEVAHLGSCLCGEVSFLVNGDFDNFILCHCKYCQKDTGSAHAANLFSSDAVLEWKSGESFVRTFTLRGTQHCKSFCELCGAALPGRQMNGALLVVPAGCLDTSLKMKPHAHINMTSKAGWDCDLESVPKFNSLP